MALRLVALAMAFKNVRNLLLINHNDGFIDDDEFVLLYDLFVSKNLDFPLDSYAPFEDLYLELQLQISTMRYVGLK